MGADSMGADKLVANQNGSKKQDQIKIGAEKNGSKYKCEQIKMEASKNGSQKLDIIKKWEGIKMGANTNGSK